MDAITLLISQHREVDKLFSAIEKDVSAKEKKELFLQIAEKLTLHTQLEEKLFYPEGKTVDAPLTLEAYEEHALCKTLIRQLTKLRATDEKFMAKVTVLKELVQHHVKEEEHDYFPECRKSLGKEEIERIGQLMEAKIEGKSVKGAKTRRPPVLKVAS